MCKDISDVLLNLNELVHSIKSAGDSKLLLSLDLSSEFDSLDHNFICDVLRLLNFPPFFITVIRNYLKDNLSCIILDDNTFTDFFKVIKSTGQGNPLSCLNFVKRQNACLCWWLELLCQQSRRRPHKLEKYFEWIWNFIKLEIKWEKNKIMSNRS